MLHERVRVERDEGHSGIGEARRAGFVRDKNPRLCIVQTVCDARVAVEHGHREQERAELPRPEEDRGRLGRRRQHDRHAVPALDAVRFEQASGLVREILNLAPGQLANGAVEPLVDHRELLSGVLVAAVRSDVVAPRDTPHVRCADLLIAAHDRPRVSREFGLAARGRYLA